MNLNDSFKRNPFLTTVIGDVNAKSNKWSDGNKPTIQASKVDFLTPQFGISQLIKEPTYILKNSSSCTDLSIYDNNKYVTDYKEKCQLFNSYFSQQFTLMKNISILPSFCCKHTNNI